MRTIPIQQFREVLAARAGASATVRAYRELTRRPEVAGGMLHREWQYWTGAPAAAKA